MKKAVIIEGGGTYGSGVLDAMVHAHRLGYDVMKDVDIIGGVSVGALITACLGMGWSVGKCNKIFKSYAKRFFIPNSSWGISNKGWLLARNMPFYKIQEAEKALKEIFTINGKVIRWCDLKFDCFAVAMRTYDPKDPYRSYYKIFKPDDTTPVYQVCCASMAAQFYFAPYVINGIEYIDGGNCDNNCVNKVLAEYEGEKVAVACFVTGGSTPKKPMRKMSTLEKVESSVSGMITGNSDGERYLAKRELGNLYYEFKPTYREDWGLDTLDHFKEMRSVCIDHFDNNKKEYRAWFRNVVNASRG